MPRHRYADSRITQLSGLGNVDEKPTATDLLKREVLRFLASDKPEVLCIRGKWGVGKSYSWEAFLAQAKATKGGIALGKYAYIPLFGVQSLDQLKNALFENTVNREDIGTEPSLDTLSANTEAVVKQIGRKSFAAALEAAGFKSAAQALQSISYLSVSKQLICIDDLERKGKDLRVQDVMGLISYLRERRKCKMVLILNEDELGTEREAFEKYQEKVIDVSLLFAPNEEDSVKIALGEKPVGALATLAEFCISLGVSNIRIIKKIERLVLQVEPLLKDMHEAVLRQSIQTLTLFGWAHYSKLDSLIEYCRQKLGAQFFGVGDEDKLTEDEKKWQGILDAYVFTNIDDLDLTLLDGIRAGFFDEERLVRRAKELDQQHKTLTSQRDIEAAWRRYHDSFDLDDQEVVQCGATIKVRIPRQSG